jgi:DNA invertase Pin-like site-specific DNA recombinase
VGLLAQLSNSSKPLARLYSNSLKSGNAAIGRASNASNVTIPLPLQVQNRLSAQEADRLVQAYLAGSSVRLLAAEFQVNRHTVSAHLERHGIARHGQKQKLTADQVPAAIDLYASGSSLVRVGEHFDVNAETVRRALRAAGIVLRPKGRPRRLT